MFQTKTMTTPEITPELREYIASEILKAKAVLIVSLLSKPHVTATDLRQNYIAHTTALENKEYESIVTWGVAKFGYQAPLVKEAK